jgi:hypothetical protein
MLNILKTAIRKKKLYFTVESTVKNVNKLQTLLINNVISGFYTSSKRNKTFLIVFINYCHNFDPSISSISINSKKVSAYQNTILSANNLGSNFIINTDMKNKNFFPNGKQASLKTKYCIKFR